jgi:LuxR family maltose regulon positive regulatory protein
VTVDAESSEYADAVGPVIEGPWTTKADAPAAMAGASGEYARPVAANVVERPRLHALLDRARDAPATILTAPAGWGKTLLAGSWVAERPDGSAVVWVTLGPGDDDPRTFWARLARAVGSTAGPTTAGALAALAGPGSVPSEIPGLFARALGRAARPVVLVLDDLHEVTSPTVHEGLLSLVERPVPSLTLLITTRRDPPWPLARLRLAGLLHELRTSDLAFRDDEAVALFERLGVQATVGQIEEMVARTDGWAAGIRLAALDLSTQDDIAGAVGAFSGSAHSVSDYLLAEVLERQPPELVAFLRTLGTVDLVSADLADALTGRDDSERMLAELAASHLFVQALGSPGRWYRLHRLLLDLLRARPAPRRVQRDLHRRAAEWFRQHDVPLEALRSAVRGSLWPLAADVVATHLVPLVLRDSAREVERIIAGVPYPVLLEHPELATALAGARIAQGRTTAVRALVDAARERAGTLADARQERLRVQHALIEGASARVAGDLDAAVRAYRAVPLDVATLGRWRMADAQMIPVIVLGNLGAAEYWTGDLRAAAGHLAASSEVAGAPALPDLNAAAHLALLAWERGELGTAQDRALAVASTAAAHGWSRTPQAAPAYLTLARIALDRDDLDGADPWLARLAEVEEIAPEPHVRLAQALALAVRRDAAGDREGALRGLRTTSAALRPWTPPRRLHEEWVLAEAGLLACGGNLSAAATLVDRLGPPQTVGALVAATRLRLRLDEQRAGSPSGDSLRGAETSDHPRLRAAAGIVVALAADAIGDEERALTCLEDALLAAAPFGLLRPFLAEPALAALVARRVDRGTAVPTFAVDILERLRGTPADERARQRGRLEPLTERERTMLRYLASALSNAEIANELYVSVNTVKTHQRAVYRKLGVAGRREAVRRARALGLL